MQYVWVPSCRKTCVPFEIDITIPYYLFDFPSSFLMDYTKSGVLIRDGLGPKKDRNLKEDTTSSSSDPNSHEVFGKIILESMETELMNMTNEWFGYNGTKNPAGTENPGNTSLGPGIDSGYVPYIDRPETYIVPVLFAIIFIIGVLGNGTLILIFLRHRTMRNVPNM